MAKKQETKKVEVEPQIQDVVETPPVVEQPEVRGRLKTWITGSVGAATSGKDVMEVHYLSERCLITQGANNFMLMN